MSPRGRPPEGYVSVEEAAELAGLGRASGYRYSEPGGLWEAEGVRIYKIGERRRYVELASLRRWIAARGGPVE